MSLKESKILFVFEGKSMEPSIMRNLENIFFSQLDGKIIVSIFDCEIFQLYQELKDDEYLDIVSVLKEKKDLNDQLKNYDSSEDFSSIYLFFDHDAHSHSELEYDKYSKMIEELLNHFDNETENGKLFISYPMVEALKDTLIDTSDCDRDCYAYIPFNINYKEKVNENCKKSDFKKWTYEDWKAVIIENLVRYLILAGCAYENISQITYRDLLSRIEQIEILKCQNRFLKQKNKIAILSGFPFFLIDYKGKKLFDEIQPLNTDKYCCYFCLEGSD